MPPTLPTDDPATLYYRRLSPGRFLLVENTDLPWSVALTRKYARAKRIPTANILSVAMGTNLRTWAVASNAALYAALSTPLTALHNAVQAQGIFMGPGTPQRVNVVGNVTSGSRVVQTAPVALANLAACSRRLEYYRLTVGLGDCLTYQVSSGANYAVIWNGVSVSEGLGQAVSGYKFPLTGTAGNTQPTHGTLYNGLGAETFVLPNQLALDLLGDAGNTTVLQGRIGVGWTEQLYTFEGTFPSEVDETPELAGRILDRALRYGEALNPANRYQQRVHVQFCGFSPTYQQTLSYAVSQMQGWGYAVDYAVRLNNLTAEMETYTPRAGSAYAQADLDAGRVRDRPYHVMVGDASNLEMLYAPYASAWQPTPGGGAWLGPSEGWLYELNGLRRGGGGGMSNQVHITVSIYGQMVAALYNLLRGMSWAEATYYTSVQYGDMFATGDPLLTPFPRADV